MVGVRTTPMLALLAGLLIFEGAGCGSPENPCVEEVRELETTRECVGGDTSFLTGCFQLTTLREAHYVCVVTETLTDASGAAEVWRWRCEGCRDVSPFDDL